MKNDKHEQCSCPKCGSEGKACSTGKCTCGKACDCADKKAKAHK